MHEPQNWFFIPWIYLLDHIPTSILNMINLFLLTD